jgi:CRISPR/Cas system endoribonuclease Cas6 (RAMP superfamily)
VELRTPTAVRLPTHLAGARLTQPLPVPELLIGRLARRWADLGGPALPAAAEGWAANVAVSRLSLRSESWLVHPPKVREIGSVGWVEFQLVGVGEATEAAASLAGLLRLGELVGLGDHTAVGMGRMRLTAL